MKGCVVVSIIFAHDCSVSEVFHSVSPALKYQTGIFLLTCTYLQAHLFLWIFLHPSVRILHCHPSVRPPSVRPHPRFTLAQPVHNLVFDPAYSHNHVHERIVLR
jgi:hypothetical protein